MARPTAIDPWAYKLALALAAKHRWRASDIYPVIMRSLGRGYAPDAVEQAMNLVSQLAIPGESFAAAHDRVVQAVIELEER